MHITVAAHKKTDEGKAHVMCVYRGVGMHRCQDRCVPAHASLSGEFSFVPSEGVDKIFLVKSPDSEVVSASRFAKHVSFKSAVDCDCVNPAACMD